MVPRNIVSPVDKLWRDHTQINPMPSASNTVGAATWRLNELEFKQLQGRNPPAGCTLLLMTKLDAARVPHHLTSACRPWQRPRGTLPHASRGVLALCAALWLSSAEPAQGTGEYDEEACRRGTQQPEDVDLDQPRQLRQHPHGLDIPPGTRIRDVRIHNRPIFDTSDPDEDGPVYRLLNWLNIPTWESALRSQLVFAEGEAYEPSKLNESERILRNRDYLTAAWISPTRLCGDEVEVSVLTRDTWTLFPTVGVSRSGGENQTALGLSDPNFLGSGKSVSVSRNRDADRIETSFSLFDPNVLGSRWQARLGYDERSDGRGRRVAVERPFFSEHALWSFGIDAGEEHLEESRFFGGDKVSRFQREVETAGIEYGRTLPGKDNDRLRLLAGYRYEAQSFSPIEGRDPPTPFPADRTLSYPWIGLQWQENRFHQSVNLTQLQRVEDIRNGVELRTEIGYSASDLGASDDRLVVSNVLSDALLADERRFADYQLSQSGHYRLDAGRAENLQATLQLRYFHADGTGRSGWFTRLRLSAAHNLTADRQLTLGGDNGLRGYPRHYQEGSRRFLWTVERRYYPDWHPFKLFHVGGVLFADAGRAWFPGSRPNGPDGGVLKDVGFGLRLASNRIEVGRMLHLDFAFPLDGDDSIDDFQVLLRGRTSF